MGKFHMYELAIVFFVVSAPWWTATAEKTISLINGDGQTVATFGASGLIVNGTVSSTSISTAGSVSAGSITTAALQASGPIESTATISSSDTMTANDFVTSSGVSLLDLNAQVQQMRRSELFLKDIQSFSFPATATTNSLAVLTCCTQQITSTCPEGTGTRFLVKYKVRARGNLPLNGAATNVFLLVEATVNGTIAAHGRAGVNGVTRVEDPAGNSYHMLEETVDMEFVVPSPSATLEVRYYSGVGTLAFELNSVSYIVYTYCAT